jgi:hypothetical protein
MPAAKNKSLWWNESTKRWQCRYDGKSYAISCRQLGVPKNKTASEAAAREWWKLKRQELDTDFYGNTGLRDAVDLAASNKKRNLNLGNEAAARYWNKFENELRQQISSHKLPSDLGFDAESGEYSLKSPQQVSPVVASAIARLLMFMMQDMNNAKHLAEHFDFGISLESAKLDAEPESDSIEEIVEQFIRKKQSKTTIQHVDSVKRHLGYFAEFAGQKAKIKTVNERLIAKFPDHIESLGQQSFLKGRKREWSHNYKKRILDDVRQFLQWCHKQDYLNRLPRAVPFQV